MLFTDHPPNENLITDQSLSRKPEHPIDTQHVAAKPATTNSFCSPFLSSTQMLCSPNLLLKPRALQSFLLQFVSLAGSQPRSVCYTGTSLPVPATTATATAAPGCTVTAPSPTAPSAVSPRCTVHIFTAFFFTFPWSCIFLKFLTP
jgi:hypothetical protein